MQRQIELENTFQLFDVHKRHTHKSDTEKLKINNL